MANVLTDGAREAFLGGDLAWDSDTFRAVLLDSTYTYDAGDDFLDDVDGGARIWTSGDLSGKTITDGIADAADLVTSALASGDTITQIWIYEHTGVESTSLLVAYYDTDGSSSPISLPTNDETIDVAWNNGTNKLFRI